MSDAPSRCDPLAELFVSVLPRLGVPILTCGVLAEWLTAPHTPANLCAVADLLEEAGHPEVAGQFRARYRIPPLSSFSWPRRVSKMLLRLGIKTTEDLLRKTPRELLVAKNFGHTSLLRVVVALDAVGLRLGSLPPLPA